MSKIAQSHLTIEWLQEALEVATKSNSKLLKWHTRNIGDTGMTSLLIIVEFEWETRLSLPEQVVLKIPSFEKGSDPFENEETAEKMRQFMILAHDSECAAYEFLSRYNLPIPKIYATELFENVQNPGVIVMEYIKNGAHRNRTDGFNLEQILRLTDFLAQMHAKCIQNTEWIDKFDDAMRKSFEEVLLNMLAEMEQTVKPRFPDFYQKFIKPLTEKLDVREFFDFHHNTPKRLGMPPVLVHGDYCGSNMVFCKDNEGKITNELLAVYDFQIAHAGDCTHDLCELMFLSCTPELRRQNTNAILEYYFTRLGFHLEENPPFSMEQLRSSFQVSQRRGAIMSITMMGLIPKSTSENSGDFSEENIKKLLDKNAKNAIDAGLPTNII